MQRVSRFSKATAAAAVLSALLSWPAIGLAQLTGIVSDALGTGDPAQTTLSGQASAARVVALGTVTSLVDTGTLSDASQPLGTGQTLGSIPGLLTAESLHATTMGWTDQVVSEASLSNLAMSVAGTGISADFIQSRALAVQNAAGSGLTSIEGLRIGGVAIAPAGIPNQLISLPGLSVILNEQTQTASGIVVNALRVRTLDGLTDVVVGSAKAGI